ncbi:MAG: anti-sigma factor family protein [Dehalococcoidia bacterium]
MPEYRKRTPPCPWNGARLTALLDGELSEAAKVQLTAHVDDCPVCAASLAQQQLAQGALRQVAETFAAPPSLRVRVRMQLNHAEPSRGFRRWRLCLAGLAAVLTVISAIGLWQLATPVEPRSVLAEVVRAHDLETLGVAPVSFAAADPTTVAGWAQSSMGKHFEVPNLDQAGYRLLGARPEPGVAPGAITLVYVGVSGRLTCTVLLHSAPLGERLALLVTDPLVHSRPIDGTWVASWGDGEAAYLLTGDPDLAALVRLAHLAARSR